MIKRVEDVDGFSCWNKAAPDEPMFILLGRDVAAPTTIRHWAFMRRQAGKNKTTDAQIQDAMRIADDMETYQRMRGATVPIMQVQNVPHDIYNPDSPVASIVPRPNPEADDALGTPQDVIDQRETKGPEYWSKPHLPELEIGRISRVCRCGAVFGAEIHGRALADAKYTRVTAPEHPCANCGLPVEASRPNSRLCRACDHPKEKAAKGPDMSYAVSPAPSTPAPLPDEYIRKDQDLRGAEELLINFMSGCRTYVSPEPMPTSEQVYAMRKRLLGYIESGMKLELEKS